MRKRKLKLMASFASLALVMGVMGVGVFAASQQSLGITTTVSFTARNIGVKVEGKIDGNGFLDSTAGFYEGNTQKTTPVENNFITLFNKASTDSKTSSDLALKMVLSDNEQSAIPANTQYTITYKITNTDAENDMYIDFIAPTLTDSTNFKDLIVTAGPNLVSPGNGKAGYKLAHTTNNTETITISFKTKTEIISSIAETALLGNTSFKFYSGYGLLPCAPGPGLFVNGVQTQTWEQLVALGYSGVNVSGTWLQEVSSSLTGDLIIPEGITGVSGNGSGYDSFWGTNLTSVIFPDSCVTFGDYYSGDTFGVFGGNCPNLTTIIIKNSSAKYDALFSSSVSNLTLLKIGNTEYTGSALTTFINSHKSKCCVTADTLISTGLNGEKAKADSMQVGDNIVYYNLDTKAWEVGTVGRITINSYALDMIKYTLSDGAYVKMTDYHPIYTATDVNGTNAGWKSYTLRYGYPAPSVNEYALTQNGWKQITNIETWTNETYETTYNFEVIDKNGQHIDSTANFLANGILVHNASPGC